MRAEGGDEEDTSPDVRPRESVATKPLLRNVEAAKTIGV